MEPPAKTSKGRDGDRHRHTSAEAATEEARRKLVRANRPWQGVPPEMPSPPRKAAPIAANTGRGFEDRYFNPPFISASVNNAGVIIQLNNMTIGGATPGPDNWLGQGYRSTSLLLHTQWTAHADEIRSDCLITYWIIWDYGTQAAALAWSDVMLGLNPHDFPRRDVANRFRVLSKRTFALCGRPQQITATTRTHEDSYSETTITDPFIAVIVGLAAGTIEVPIVVSNTTVTDHDGWQEQILPPSCASFRHFEDFLQYPWDAITTFDLISGPPMNVNPTQGRCFLFATSNRAPGQEPSLMFNYRYNFTNLSSEASGPVVKP